MAYSTLECINGTICRVHSVADSDQTLLAKAETRFLSWCRDWIEVLNGSPRDLYNLRILAYSTMLALLVNLDTLERAVGRDGPDAAAKALPDACVWAMSPQASRCLRYAYATSKEAEHICAGSTPALHVPRAIFQAGLVFHCFGMFHSQPAAESLSEPAQYSELDQVLGRAFLTATDRGELERWENPKTARSKLLRLIDVFQRLGTWGMSARLTETLSNLAAYNHQQF